MIFAAIADWAAEDEYDVKLMCSELEVSRSGYYKWRAAPVPERDRTDATLTTLITKVFADARGNAGVRRVVAALRAAGHVVGRRRVLRLMRALGLQGRHPRAWRRTTVPGAAPVSAPDLISRDFTADAPNQRWCGDITYVRVWDDKWAYVATVIDLHSRAVVGFAVAEHMRTSLVTEALRMAITSRRPPAGVDRLGPGG